MRLVWLMVVLTGCSSKTIEIKALKSEPAPAVEEAATTEEVVSTIGVAPSSMAMALREAITQAESGGSSQAFGTPNVVVPEGTHQVHFLEYGSDYNAYPAGNAVLLQGTVEGPLGDEDWSLFWVTASRLDGEPDHLPHVEVVLVYPGDAENEGEDIAVVQAIEAPLAASAPPPYLLGVRTLEIADVDGDGTYEALLDVVYQPCCEPGATPVEERLLLRLANRTFTVSASSGG